MENEKITRSEKNEDILKNKKKRKHHKKRQNKLYLIIKIAISIVCIFISLYFFVSLIKTNMIPNKYLLIAGGILLIFNIIILLMLLYRKVWLNIIAFIFVIVIGSISFIGSNYTPVFLLILFRTVAISSLSGHIVRRLYLQEGR